MPVSAVALLQSAPASLSKWMTLTWPAAAARHNGVLLCPAVEFFSTPASNNSWMGLTCPFLAAWCNGVTPAWSCELGSLGQWRSFSRATESLWDAVLDLLPLCFAPSPEVQAGHWLDLRQKFHLLTSPVSHLPKRTFAVIWECPPQEIVISYPAWPSCLPHPLRFAEGSKRLPCYCGAHLHCKALGSGDNLRVSVAETEARWSQLKTGTCSNTWPTN